MCSCIGINCTFTIPCDQLVLCCFPHDGAPRRRSINGLRDDWRQLKAERDHTKRRIRESNPRMLPTEQVTEWLRQVAALESKIKTLTTKYNRLHPDNTPESANNSIVRDESQEANICCICSPIVNPIKSCLLWRKIQFTDQKVLDLLKQRPPDIIENPLLAPAQQMPTDPTTGMQSMVDKIWIHFENRQSDHERLIGLHGLGGVGKTTLLIAVNNKLCSCTLNFDLQLFIVVSKTPDLIDIQNQIGAKVGFHDENWKTKIQREKATDIYNVLLNKKYILLLDDLWDRFDLKKIGIPLPNFTNKSMIIFTTRSQDVCSQMKATEIQVQCLNKVEAWNLFEKNVGRRTLKAHRNIPDRARVLMEKCNGLPLALVVIGQAMSSKKTIHDWEYAIEVLKRYTSDLSSTMKEEVFIPLKYSYDNLTNDAIRSCLLYCSLYAKDREILKSDLVDKWICEGFLSTFDDLHDARNEGYSYISTLVRASLLEECSLKKKVKMHDVIRDMALWIAGDGFYVKARAGLTRIPRDVKWEHVKKLSLMYNSIKELNNGPIKVTNLETMLFYKVGLRSINRSDFWKFFPKIKVLDLAYNKSLRSLPKEFGDLVCLQYLDLSYTRLKKLPGEFKKLVKLKYLNVEHTNILTIPEGVLSNMKKLIVFICGEELSRVLNPVKEFKGLKYLQDVQIIMVTSKVEISNLTSINLLNCITRFTITSFSDSTSLDILFLKEMKHLRTLTISSLTKVERIVVGKGQGLETSTTNNRNGFNNLRSLEISSCPRLTNLSWLVFFPNIERIMVSICDAMRTLVSENKYRVDNEVEHFAKLHTLELTWMPKLESIYFTSLTFPCLNSLKVLGKCLNLKKLPFNSRSCDQGRGITIKGLNDWWYGLEWEDEATRTTFSSRFQTFVYKRNQNLVKGRRLQYG